MKLTIGNILGVAILIVLFTSCATMRNEIWINKEKNIKSVTTYEVGEAIGGFVNLFSQSNSDADNTDEEFNIDSTMYISEQIPPEFRKELLYPAFWDSLIVRIHGDTKENIKLDMSLVYGNDFNSETFLEHWRQKAMSDPTIDTSVVMNYAHQYVYNTEKQYIRIPQFDLVSFLKQSKELVPQTSIDTIQMIIDKEIEFDEAAGTRLTLMKAFEHDITTIANTPAKIKFTNDPNAIIESYKVTFVRNIQDEIQTGDFGTKSDYIIKLE